MWDSSLTLLTRNIVAHSLELSAGQRVYIDLVGDADELTDSLIKEIYHSGAQPFVRIMPIHYLKSLLMDCSQEQIVMYAKHELYRMKTMDAFVGIRADENAYEMEDVPPDKYNLYMKHYLQPLQSAMASLGKWVLLRYPTFGMAQLAKMSMREFTEMYYLSCNMDYTKLKKCSEPLQELLLKTDRVRILSPGTDLHFSIKGIANFLCDGKYNLPDGEIFTSPVVDSVEGVILFNVPSMYMGIVFEKIELEFHQGKIIRASCNQSERLQAIINSDEGSTRLGEFGIGINPYIRKPMNSLPFDEKMAGSIHLAVGQAYEMAYNGNESAVHWDLVLNQLKEYGGGELYFDQKLVRKDGVFVLPELALLNEL